ncbi:MAG: transposase domain-containing protein [Planctomycetaceae bacterium]|nr:transposase domain-containing protein [Planctomycetaceae bacterium]
MSQCTTCKNLGIDPQAYLGNVLDRISTHPARRIEELRPDRWQALRQAAEAAKDRPPFKPRGSSPSPGTPDACHRSPDLRMGDRGTLRFAPATRR